jgi:uncharacterized protein YbjT (DUF2867 family)
LSRLRIFITGSTGNVGRHLVDHLVDRGVEVRVGVRSRDSDVQRALRRAVEPVYFDLEDARTHAPALEGVRKLFLLRPRAVSDGQRHLRNVVEAARQAGVKHLVFLSVLGAQRNPFSLYARLERAIRKSGVPSTFLRSGFLMQHLSTTHAVDIRERGEVFVPAGKGKAAFIDARDLAAAAARVLLERGHEGKAYELTGAEALDYSQVAATFSKVLDQPIRYTSPSTLRFLFRWMRRGASLSSALELASLFRGVRRGRAARITHDVQELLGHPPISLRQFVEDHHDCWE